MTLDDFKSHKSQFITPISTRFHGLDVHEVPPNGQGITALLALNILTQLIKDEKVPAQGTAEFVHLQIEALRLAFADAKWFVSDMEHNTSLPVSELLSEWYAQKRAMLVNRTKAAIDPKHGSPALGSETVSFQVIDGRGNAVSMVNSNYEGFGTGLIPHNCGFSLQNRGCNFELHGHKVGHPNALAPRKRPYHTIIPGLLTFAHSGELHSSFSVMGGFMQPQGHVQVLSNMLLHSMNPQEALDAPRFCIDVDHFTTLGGKERDSCVLVETDLGADVIAALRDEFGHRMKEVKGLERAVFGRGQIIVRDPHTGVLCAGSDGRADGCAMGW